MGVWKDVGLTIAAYKAGERGRRLRLLLAGRGVTTAAARGAERPKSAVFAAARPFALSRFVFFEGGGFVSATDAEVIRGFFGLASDYGKFEAASAVVAVVDAFVMPGEPMRETLRLCVRALSAIERGAADPELTAAVFKLKFFQAEGLVSAERAPEAAALILETPPERAFGFRAGASASADVIAFADRSARAALERRIQTDK
ncbi:MAG: DNA repair protein RecO [Clostridiales bacterium]|jgi:DNA repair protein RecO (recombination protein O)|nr:DNA repair protein RecO [Clostridiales bacterium]